MSSAGLIKAANLLTRYGSTTMKEPKATAVTSEIRKMFLTLEPEAKSMAKAIEEIITIMPKEFCKRRMAAVRPRITRNGKMVSRKLLIELCFFEKKDAK